MVPKVFNHRSLMDDIVQLVAREKHLSERADKKANKELT